jgi:iron complex outermembrane recepter protein
VDRSNYSRVAAAAASLLVLSASPSTAQEQTDSGLDEIVITATKRGDVDAQRVTASVTAFDEVKLERLNATDFEDFIVQVPGTNFVDNGGPGRGQDLASIRGLSPVADNTGAVVAEYLDGAPRFGRNYRLFDIGEVAVLRGPQGTLWGAQAVGGLISYRSKRPNLARFEAYLETDAYTTRDASPSYRLSGAVNLPLIDETLAVRVAAHHIDESGYVDNIAVGKDDINDVLESSWRVSALYAPTNNWQISLAYHGSDLNTDAPSFFNVSAGELVSTDPYTNLFGDQRYSLGIVGVEGDFGWAQLSYSGSVYDMTQNYDDVERNGFGFIPVSRISTTNEEESVTHELRLSSSGDGPWDWVVGAYFDDFDSDLLRVNREVSDPTDPQWLPGVAEGFAISVIGGPQTFKERAIFGEIGYQFSERWSALVGARVFDWEVTNNQELTFFGNNFNQTTGTVDDRDSFYKLQLDFRPTDDVALYLTRSEGFRFGGFNPFVGLPGIGPDVLRFSPDTLVNYELGAKTVWADGRVALNATVYRADWEDVQVVVFAAPPSPFAYTTNGGLLESKGFELELTAKDFAVPGLYVSASLTSADAEFRRDVNPNGAASALIEAGDKLRRSPDNTWSLDLGYDFEIAGGAAYVRANYWHKDRTTTEGFNSGGGSIDAPAQDVVNFSAGFDKASWSVKLYADNVTDEAPLLQISPLSTDPNEINRASTIRPRTIGLQVRYSLER